MSVMKQRSNCGHFWPEQSSRRASILFHAALDSGSVLISARSPNSVVFSHSLDDLEVGDFFEAVEDGLLFGIVDFLAAGVVVAALHVADFERAREMFLQERNVLEEELLLQVLGAGGNDDALAGEDGGDQIGERFAGAGAGFDDQMLAVGERGFDGLGHFELAGAVFVIRMPLGKRSMAGEELAHAGRFRGSGHSSPKSHKTTITAEAQRRREHKATFLSPVIMKSHAAGSSLNRHRRASERREIDVVQSHHGQAARHCGG